MQERHEKGAAAVTVAIALLLLIGFASLAIDGSLGYDERRDIQNAADNAAYAAAYEHCNPRDASSTPQGAAETVALQNGFDAADPDVTVTVVGSDAEWTVTIAVQDIRSQLGSATPYANDELDVVASGTARCDYEPFLGGYAIFADADACPQRELDITGDDIDITGSVHSNEDVKITGSDPSVNGDITYVLPGGANLSAPLTATDTTNQPMPLDPGIIAEYRPGGSRSSDANYVSYLGDIGNDRLLNPSLPDTVDWGSGNNSTIVFEQSGIIYTDGEIDLKDVSMDPGVSVTFVAEGKIKLVANGNIRGYDPIDPTNPNSTAMTVFSNKVVPKTCAPGPSSAVDISTSSINWEGLIFAPNGLVTISAASGTTISGSIIAYQVNLSGSNISVTYDDSANADPTYQIDLLR